MAQIETCSTCPYFEDYYEANKRGWCHIFDHQARTHHAKTDDCDQAILALEENETTVGYVMELERKLEESEKAAKQQTRISRRWKREMLAVN